MCCRCDVSPSSAANKPLNWKLQMWIESEGVAIVETRTKSERTGGNEGENRNKSQRQEKDEREINPRGCMLQQLRSRFRRVHLLMKYTSCRRGRGRGRGGIRGQSGKVWWCGGICALQRQNERDMKWQKEEKRQSTRRSLNEMKNDCPFHLVSQLSMLHCVPSYITRFSCNDISWTAASNSPGYVDKWSNSSYKSCACLENHVYWDTVVAF